MQHTCHALLKLSPCQPFYQKFLIDADPIILLQPLLLRLLEELDPLGEELGVACYKLSAYLYAHDMLPEAGSAVRRASDIMRHHYSDEGSDMVGACEAR